MDGRTRLNLLTSLLPSRCLFEDFSQPFSKACSSNRAMLLAIVKLKGCMVAALSFRDIRWDQSTKNQEQYRVSWRRLKGLQEL